MVNWTKISSHEMLYLFLLLSSFIILGSIPYILSEFRAIDFDSLTIIGNVDYIQRTGDIPTYPNIYRGYLDNLEGVVFYPLTEILFLSFSYFLKIPLYNSFSFFMIFLRLLEGILVFIAANRIFSNKKLGFASAIFYLYTKFSIWNYLTSPQNVHGMIILWLLLFLIVVYIQEKKFLVIFLLVISFLSLSQTHALIFFLLSISVALVIFLHFLRQKNIRNVIIASIIFILIIFIGNLFFEGRELNPLLFSLKFMYEYTREIQFLTPKTSFLSYFSIIDFMVLIIGAYGILKIKQQVIKLGLFLWCALILLLLFFYYIGFKFPFVYEWRLVMYLFIPITIGFLSGVAGIIKKSNIAIIAICIIFLMIILNGLDYQNEVYNTKSYTLFSQDDSEAMIQVKNLVADNERVFAFTSWPYNLQTHWIPIIANKMVMYTPIQTYPDLDAKLTKIPHSLLGKSIDDALTSEDGERVKEEIQNKFEEKFKIQTIPYSIATKPDSELSKENIRQYNITAFYIPKNASWIVQKFENSKNYILLYENQKVRIYGRK